jgi:SAM-dependent MidA family methyltransferase
LAEQDLAFGLTGPMQPNGIEDRLAVAGDGSIVEVSIAAQGLAERIGARIAADGGAALIIDYGDGPPAGDTFQAVQAHQKVDPLAAPGAVDLTAHVDFAALARAARPAVASAATPQGVFLERLGITERARTLARGLSGAALQSHIAAHRRLTHPTEMGTLFKVMALRAAISPALPGVDP